MENEQKNYNYQKSEVRLTVSEANYFLSTGFALSRVLSHGATEKNNTQTLPKDA